MEVYDGNPLVIICEIDELSYKIVMGISEYSRY